MDNLHIITEVPKDEQKAFDTLIKDYRKEYIRSTEVLLKSILRDNTELIESIKNKRISQSIQTLRELVWQAYLKDEVQFNAYLMKDLYTKLDTPKEMLDVLIKENIILDNPKELEESIRKTCGEYAGRVFPYIYRLSLSNTQSRRSRAGATFEYIVYYLYDVLEYDYDSQKKVGRKLFDTMGLGKKVDSIMPSIEAYSQRRNKTIIGTMKTSLRERWQEVAEEIERTKIPEIHLLTVDEDISLNKAKEMAQHNIIVVTYEWISNNEKLKGMKNITSFEEYFFEELPVIYKYWSDND
ncbi:MAG: type II restriction endonuclease [Campylobacterota bacterium]|nr:type II restriction endonuclease [Campylobacterota bacterium]